MGGNGGRYTPHRPDCGVGYSLVGLNARQGFVRSSMSSVIVSNGIVILSVSGLARDGCVGDDAIAAAAVSCTRQDSGRQHHPQLP